MTFKDALVAKTIKERASIIGTFIDQSPIGKISQENMDIFLTLFENYYFPDEGEYKYTRNDIASIAIYWNETSRFKPSKCFYIILHDHSQKTDKERQPIPVSRKRLSGENRTGYANLMKALREIVDSQIMEFKVKHPLQPTDICPIMNIPIGMNAEVDHVGKTFKKLTEEWLQNNPGVKPKSHPTIHSSYIIDEPYCSSWYNYHKDHATLRWLSYEGNRVAHRI